MISQNTTESIDPNPYPTYYPNMGLRIVTAFIACFGLSGNLFVLLLIANKFMSRKPYEWLLFNLALVDFCQCLNNIALQVPFIGRYESGPCQAAGYIEYLIGFQSFLLPPIIAYNRYLSLYDHQKCENIFTRLRTALMCLCTWLFSALIFLPFVLTGDLGEDDLGLCGLRRKINGQRLQWSLAYVILLMVARILIGLCYLTLFVCSYKIIKKLRHHATHSSPGVHSRLIDESKELVTLTLLIFLIPFLTQSPAMTAKTIFILVPNCFTLSHWSSRLFIILFSLPSAIDPYMTLYIVKDYRKKVAGWLKR